MKKYIIILIACAMCACGGNNPEEPQIDDIYAPIKQYEYDTISRLIENNYDCLVEWLGGQYGDELQVMKITSIQKDFVVSLDEHFAPCFPDVYTHYVSDTIIDGKYTYRSYLKERIFGVSIWCKWRFITEKEKEDMLKSGGGRPSLFFDSHYRLIHVRAWNDCTECECWQQ